jgi:hypothetical protein
MIERAGHIAMPWVHYAEGSPLERVPCRSVASVRASDREASGSLFEVCTEVFTSRACPSEPAHLNRMVERDRSVHAGRNGPCRDRTCDLGIKSPLLYQLS